MNLNEEEKKSLANNSPLEFKEKTDTRDPLRENPKIRKVPTQSYQ